MREPFRRPSPAMVVACLALFVAMTGTSIAAGSYLITSTKQIKPSVLKQLKGAKGPQGPAGTPGAPGAAGAAGANGATHVVKRTAEGTWGTGGSMVTAYCNSGEVATGGGADWDDATTTGWPLVSFSVPYPYNTTTPPSGWQVEVDNASTTLGSGVQAIAWVLCASP